MSDPAQDPAQDGAWRSARRAAALRHHPDRGGDAAALHAALAEVDRRFGRAPRGTSPRVTRTWRGRWQARARRLRRRLPRRRGRRRTEI